LEWGASYVQQNGEALPLTLEVFFQLPLCPDQDWLAIVIPQIAENHPTRIVILPQNRYEALFTGYEP